MTNNNMYNERNYTGRQYSDRARAITARKKAKARKQRILIGTVAVALVAVIAAGAMVFGAMNAPKVTKTAAPTTAISVKAAAPVKAASVKKTAVQQTAAQKTATQQAATQQVATQQVAAQKTAAQQTFQSAPAAQPAQPSTVAPAPAPTQAPVKDRIDNVNGERIYIDTKRVAPANSGTPYHFYANGKTSYGFDWTYKADNLNFLLRCDYNFNQQQYDFQFYGVTPGTSHVTLYYNTDDNVQVPVNLTVTVDSALNVTAA